MKRSSKTAAETKGREVLATMPNEGKGWKLEVWQNDGWHFCLKHGPVSVYENTDAKYHCMIADNAKESGIGGCWGDEPKSFATPWEAVCHKIEVVRNFIDEQVKVWNGLQDAMRKLVPDGQ